jgi:hypothetical protein
MESNLKAGVLPANSKNSTGATKLWTVGWSQFLSNRKVPFHLARCARNATAHRLESSDFGASFRETAGPPFAIVLSVNTGSTAHHQDRTMSFVRVIRGFAGASLAVLAFAIAILLIGIPIALIVRGLHEGLSWLVR